MTRIRVLSAIAGFLLFLPSADAVLVISEVMWMGSDLSAFDEWVELACVGDPTDLGGYSLRIADGPGPEATEKEVWRFDGQMTVAPGAYLVIGRRAATESRLLHDPDFLAPLMSLPNTKLLLRLYDGDGVLVDEVDDGIGVPFAGANPSDGPKASMERIDVSAPGTVKENWRTASTSQGFDGGVPIFGTPGHANGMHNDTPQDEGKEDEEEDEEDEAGGIPVIVDVPDATELAAAFSGNAIVVSWQPSVAASLHAYVVTLHPPAEGVGEWILPRTATGTVLPAPSDTATVRVVVLDAAGNRSPGTSVTVERPRSEASRVVLVTEVLANPIGPDDEEWIEVGNLGHAPVDIGGWVLGNGTANGRYAIPPRSPDGFILAPGEHRAFPKSLTSLVLPNKGGTLTLHDADGVSVDTWAYAETAEEVSVGRDPVDPAVFRPFCIPTPDAPNAVLPPEPVIDIQSGQTTGVGKVSLNLRALTERGSLSGMSCRWEYGDGYTSESCNPPSRTFSNPGSYTISLAMTDYCGNTVTRTLPVHVSPALNASSSSSSSSSSLSTTAPQCTIRTLAGIRISEFLPDPAAKDEPEWIELVNTTATEASLCGWSLDDEEGGSKPYVFGDIRLAPGEYRAFLGSLTKIVLNNGTDSIRLFRPASHDGGSLLVEEIRYEKSVKGESYALREDGLFLWTPFLSPDAQNRFRSAVSAFDVRVIVSAALPNPAGADAGKEWIEITNLSAELVVLDGWLLDNKEGGSKPYALTGVRLKPGETRRFSDAQTGIVLTNASDMARLIDPHGTTASFLTWKNAVDGRIYRTQAYEGERVQGTVRRVIDGDTIDVDLTGTSEVFAARTSVRVRLLGIDAPESVHPTLPVSPYGVMASEFLRALLEGKNIELHFDTETWDAYDRALAYVYTSNNIFVQEELLRHGMASVYLRFPFAKREEFLVYESEARNARMGLWSDEAFVESIHKEQMLQESDLTLFTKGLSLSAKPLQGFVEPGTVVRFSPSLPADIYLREEHGVRAFSGSVTVDNDMRIELLAIARSPSCSEIFESEDAVLAFADAAKNDGETVDNPCIARFFGSYLIKKASYGAHVRISEVYPRPLASSSSLLHFDPLYEEWIELHNPQEHAADISGWLLDDIADGGSKPFAIPFGTILAPGEYRVFPKRMTKITLNDDKDAVRLLSPDGQVADEMSYGKMKHPGWSVAWVAGQWCVTGTPTPGAENRCGGSSAALSAAQKKSGAGATSKTVSIAASVLKPKYRNVVQDADALLDAVSPALSHLRGRRVLLEAPERMREGEPSTSLPLETPLVGIGAFGAGWFLSVSRRRPQKVDKK